MPDETQLIKGYLCRVIAHNIHDGALHIDEALALIFSFLSEDCNRGIVGRSDYRNEINTAGLNRTLNNRNAHFAERVALLVQYFANMGIEDKRNLLIRDLQMHHFITEVEQDGYLSFHDRLLNAYLQTRTTGEHTLEYYLVDFGAMHLDDQAALQVDAQIVRAAEEPRPAEQTGERRNREPSAEAISRYVTLYNNWRTKFDTHYKYAWQYLLTNKDYEALKACVEAGVPTPGKINREIATILYLYIGEYYKRVGRGLGNTIYTNTACAILNTLGKPLYGAGRYLDSLYADGGLSIGSIIQRITNGNTYNKYIKALNGLLNPSDEEERQSAEDTLFNDINNTSISQSYINRQSIYEYIRYLKEGNRTWDASDDQTFQPFRDLITTGIARSKTERKFRISFQLWQYQDQMGIVPSVRFSPAAEGKYRYLVPKELAKNWGIVINATNSFIATISQKTEAIKQFAFVRNVNGDYIEMEHQDTAVLNQIMLNNDADWGSVMLKEYLFILKTDAANAEIDKSQYFRNGLPEKMRKDNYLQLYTNAEKGGFRTWQFSKGSVSYKYSAILFDYDRYDVRASVKDQVKEISSSIAWVEFEDSVQLVEREGNKTITIHNNKGRIYATPTQDFIHPICNNPLIAKGIVDGAVEVGNGEKYYIVKPQLPFRTDNFFEVRYVSNDEIVNNDNIEVKVFNDTTQEFEPYNAEQHTLTGHIRFQITVLNYSTEVDCFFLLENANIKAERETSNRLRFVGFNDYINSLREANLPFVDAPFVTNPLNEDFICSDNAQGNFVTIHFPTANAQVQVYRPRFGVFGFVKGTEVNATVSNPYSLPLIYAADAHLTQINAERVENIDLRGRRDIFKTLFNRLIEGNKLTAPLGNQPIKGLSLRIYTRDIQDNDNALSNLQWGFLYLDECKLKMCPSEQKNAPIAWVNSLNANGILFQSLKDEGNPQIFCQPIHITHQNAQPQEKNAQTQTPDNTIFYQFEVACTHRMYFASLDSILSFITNKNREGEIHMKLDKLYSFLSGYWTYTQEKNTYPHVNGLLRLAREFGFSWEDKKIEKQINNSNNQELKVFYDEELK